MKKNRQTVVEIWVIVRDQLKIVTCQKEGNVVIVPASSLRSKCFFHEVAGKHEYLVSPLPSDSYFDWVKQTYICA